MPQRTRWGGGGRKTKLKVSREKEILKIRVEIIEIETKKTIEKSVKLRTVFFEKIK